MDERLDDVSEGWLAGVEVRGEVMQQRSGVNLVLHSGGALHHGLHHGDVVDWAGNRQH